MIQRLSITLSRFAHRWVPDPLTITALLTLFTLGSALLSSDRAPLEVVDMWGDGVWGLLSFSMQMCLVLVTGHALATSSPVRAVIDKVAILPRAPRHAIGLTALIALIAGWLNWGLGLIVGALMAREVGRAAQSRGLKVHYPLLGAAGYTGLLIWHGGLSGSAPLTMTQASGIKKVFGDAQLNPLPLTETTFSGLNLTISLLLLLLVPLILMWMSPDEAQTKSIEDFIPQDDSAPEADAKLDDLSPTPAKRLETSRFLSVSLTLICGLYLIRSLQETGVSGLGLNSINLAFLTLGLLCAPHLLAYGEAVQRAVVGCAGVILQFPLYAGIMGLMKASGLTALIATGFASIASPETFAPLTFLSAGLVNLFVPSGGGQWAVQGPLIFQSAQATGAPLAEAVVAFSHGDAWTNMLQPFWALPLLGITQLSARDVVGYTATLMICVLPIYLVCFWIY